MNGSDDVKPVTSSAERPPRRLPLKWVDIEDAPLFYSNSYLAQNNGHEFVLTFAYVHPPVTIGLNADELDDADFIRARAQVRIALSPSRFRELVEVVAANYERFRQTHTPGLPAVRLVPQEAVPQEAATDDAR